ncbi:MAG TPA: MerR family transcriptional regulator [candidate division Zixibacteria bacterium]|nr:MerR family transcriptional regulator [candidate division Zixibacteria bacterium]HEQ99144.1 MerR family transcriptional regulator [candidate division Zixibacteria bacterium]
MTVKEAAKYLGVNPETLRRWDNKGKLKTRRHPMNNFRIYSKADIERIKKKISGGE